MPCSASAGQLRARRSRARSARLAFRWHPDRNAIAARARASAVPARAPRLRGPDRPAPSAPCSIPAIAPRRRARPGGALRAGPRSRSRSVPRRRSRRRRAEAARRERGREPRRRGSCSASSSGSSGFFALLVVGPFAERRSRDDLYRVAPGFVEIVFPIGRIALLAALILAAIWVHAQDTMSPMPAIVLGVVGADHLRDRADRARVGLGARAAGRGD